jgi:hypothetical protein
MCVVKNKTIYSTSAAVLWKNIHFTVFLEKKKKKQEKKSIV